MKDAHMPIFVRTMFGSFQRYFFSRQFAFACIYVKQKLNRIRGFDLGPFFGWEHRIQHVLFLKARVQLVTYFDINISSPHCLHIAVCYHNIITRL